MKQKSHFWASYADLMTSLFFIMFILFVLTVCMLQKEIIKTDAAWREAERQRRATQEQLDKIREIEEGISKIDPTLFEYNPKYKKHILKIDVSFPRGSSDMNTIDNATLERLRYAGTTVRNFIKEAHDHLNVQYLLIIEGQASRDNYALNDQLSYNRALALYKYWKSNNIGFGRDACEVIISGSGQDGVLRMQPDNSANEANQRFLIHIVPKPGIIGQSK